MILVDVSSFVFVEWFQRIKWQRRGYIIHMKRSIDSPTTLLQVQSFFLSLWIYLYLYLSHAHTRVFVLHLRYFWQVRVLFTDSAELIRRCRLSPHLKIKGNLYIIDGDDNDRSIRESAISILNLQYSSSIFHYQSTMYSRNIIHRRIGPKGKPTLRI